MVTVPGLPFLEYVNRDGLAPPLLAHDVANLRRGANRLAIHADDDVARLEDRPWRRA